MRPDRTVEQPQHSCLLIGVVIHEDTGEKKTMLLIFLPAYTLRVNKVGINFSHSVFPLVNTAPYDPVMTLPEGYCARGCSFHVHLTFPLLVRGDIT